MKRLVSMILVLAMVFAFAACGQKTTTQPAAAEQTTQAPTASDAAASAFEETEAEIAFPEMTLLYDTTCTEASTSGQGALITVKYIEDATNGAVKVDKHDNYSLFAQDQIIPAVMSGELSMSATTAAYMADYMPKLTVLASAYLFSSFDHWKDYYNSEDWLKLTDEIAAETNVRVIGVSNKGGRTINLNTDKKILHRSDMAGISLRMPNSDSWLFLGEALGGNPVPVVGADIYMALQTGMVDAQENPIGNTLDMGLYEVTKSVTLTNHMYLEDWFIVNEDVWKSMTPEMQQVMRDAVAAGYDYVTDSCWSSLEQQMKEITEQYGIVFYDMTDEERGAYREEVLQYYFDKGKADAWDMDLYNVIQSYSKT